MKAIFQHAAQALANLQIPTFDGYDEATIFWSFDHTTLTSKDWLTEFQQAIKDESNGQTELIECEFYTGIRGINKTFLLKHGDVEKRVVIATGIPPIEFWNK